MHERLTQTNHARRHATACGVTQAGKTDGMGPQEGAFHNRVAELTQAVARTARNIQHCHQPHQKIVARWCKPRPEADQLARIFVRLMHIVLNQPKPSALTAR